MIIELAKDEEAFLFVQVMVGQVDYIEKGYLVELRGKAAELCCATSIKYNGRVFALYNSDAAEISLDYELFVENYDNIETVGDFHISNYQSPDSPWSVFLEFGRD